MLPDIILFHSLALKIVIAFGALELALFYLGRIDKRMGIAWKADVLKVILGAPQAAALYFGARFVGVCLLLGHVVGAFLLMAVLSAPAEAGIMIPSTYDRSIKAAAEQYLPGVPWKLWKAELVAESGLNPDARSPVGAEGLAQVMPATWQESVKAMGLGIVDRRQAEPSIKVGAYYLGQLRKRWTAIPDLERMKYSQGSYNAGSGNIHRAFVACEGTPAWSETAICLPEITGRNSVETVGYVKRIWSIWIALEAKI